MAPAARRGYLIRRDVFLDEDRGDEVPASGQEAAAARACVHHHEPEAAALRGGTAMNDPTTVLLCATRFWAGGAGAFPRTTPTLRKGVRHVARKQGITPRELDKAERGLVAKNLLVKPRKGVIALTEKGLMVATWACRDVPLPPWDPKTNFGGSRRRRK